MLDSKLATKDDLAKLATKDDLAELRGEMFRLMLGQTIALIGVIFAAAAFF